MKFWITYGYDIYALEKDMQMLTRATLTQSKEIQTLLLSILNKCIQQPGSVYCRQATLNLISYCSTFETLKTLLHELATVGFEELACFVPLIKEILNSQADCVPRFKALL